MAVYPALFHPLLTQRLILPNSNSVLSTLTQLFVTEALSRIISTYNKFILSVVLYKYQSMHINVRKTEVARFGQTT